MNIRKHMSLLPVLALCLSALLIPSTDTSVAQKSVVFTKDDCSCSLPGMDLVDTQVNTTLQYSYLNCQYGSPQGSGKNWVEISVFYYNDTSKALSNYQNSKDVFADAAGWAKDGRTQGVEPASLITEVSEVDRYGYVVYNYRPQALFYWGEMALLRNSNFVAYVHLSGPQMGAAEATSFLDSGAKCATAIIDNKSVKDTTFAFKYYPPIITGKEAAPYVGGDLVALVRDKKTNRLVGDKEVYFFKKDYSVEDVSFNQCLKFPQTDPLYIDGASLNQLGGGHIASDYASDSTSVGVYEEGWAGLSASLGEARFNYLSSKALIFDALVKSLKKRDVVSGTVYAVMFDKSSRQTYPDGSKAKIVHIAQTQVELKGIAAITSSGIEDTLKPSVIKVLSASTGEKMVNTLPYYLREDVVYIDNNTRITITWLSGLSLSLRVKPGFLEDGKFEWISIGYKYLGSFYGDWVWADSWVGNLVVEGATTIAPSIIGTLAGPSCYTGFIIGGPISIGVGLLVLGYEGAKSQWNPLIIEPRSEILIDTDEDGYQVYTLEGSAGLHPTDGGSALDVTQGHATTVTTDGQFGPLTEFKEADLNAEMAAFVQAIREDQPASDTENPGLGFEQPPFPSSDSDDSSKIIWLVGLVAGMVVLGMASILLRKKRRQTAPAYDPHITPRQNQPSMPVNPGPRVEEPLKGELPVISCPGCGTQAQPGKKFCGKCGAALPSTGQMSDAQVYCSKCGASNEGGSLFCRKCGSKLAL
ncbi:MAG: zinc ribbon domain-containing protein [Dehalococcoidia bacterium]|nr:zinc ribbon domain-containing protein [Dehalococcoidia bacterium]